jgi:hypothetical protein
VGLTVGYPYNVCLRYNPYWRWKRKLDKAVLRALYTPWPPLKAFVVRAYTDIPALLLPKKPGFRFST